MGTLYIGQKGIQTDLERDKPGKNRPEGNLSLENRPEEARPREKPGRREPAEGKTGRGETRLSLNRRCGVGGAELEGAG